MTTYSPALTYTRSSGRSRWMALVAAFVALVFATQVPAQAPAAPGGAAVVPSAEAMDKLVGRIALYPDDLVAVILPASTFPLEIVQAERFLQKRKADPKLPLDDKWDDSVKTLLNYPDVVKSMSDDLDWTSDLGEAVVADQGAVLEAIQVFRRRTQSVGNLKSDDKQTVVVEKEVITIVPANPQVVYVPTYNPSTVVVAGGYSSYGYYPAPYPSYYYPYPPGAALATGLIWGAAIGAAWSGGRYGASYGGGGNTININNSTNVNRSGSASQRPAGGSGQSSQWKSNKQPGQVSSGGGRSQSARVGDSGSRGGAGGAAGGARPSTQPAGGASNRGGGAFDGGGASGRQTQMDSSRGAASRASSPSAGTRQSSAGSARSSGASAGARSSGGGGGARGGGGGRGGGGRR